MSSYDLPESITLFSAQVGIVNSLWTVYVAATFTAAGFGHTLDSQNLIASIAITFGFWAFTLGHLHLLRQALKVLKVLSETIIKVTQARTGSADLSSDFASVVQHLAKTANRPNTATAIHLFIDACVTVAIWEPYLPKR